MKNFVQKGNIVDFTTPAGGVVAGMAYVFGSVVAVAANTVTAAGVKTPFAVEGVFDLPAETTAAFAEGQTLYWDAANSRLTATAGALKKAGYAVDAKAQADAVARVNLITMI